MSKTATGILAFFLILQILGGGFFFVLSAHSLRFAAQLEMLMFQYGKY